MKQNKSNETKFTSGPWKVGGLIQNSKYDTSGYAIDREDNDNPGIETVAVTYNAKSDSDLANAQLIAAAPEMYEAAEQLIYRLEVCLDDLNQSGEAAFNADHEISILKEALAKARGEL